MKFSYMLPRNTKAKALNMVLNSNDRYDRHYRAKVAKKLRDLARYHESGRVFDPYTVDRPCRVIAHIYPPTKQDMDPPNVWPTVKPLMDGLTDAGVWNGFTRMRGGDPFVSSSISSTDSCSAM